MRFCDKLPKIRKENNLSQEQLADKLNVSRQAVSKWESGSSYPDMDKILQICKILNCKLEDLLDDGVIGNQKQNNKVDFNNSFNEFLKFITKSYNMFYSMTIKEKIKCLIEMIIIFMLLFIIGGITYQLANGLLFDMLVAIPTIGYALRNIFDALSLIALLIIGIIIFIHLFKIRYLDYFITIEDKDATKKTVEEEILDEKIVGNKKYVMQKEKQKVIIRDPEHSTLGFISLLGKLFLGMIKIFLAFIFVLVVLAFLGLIVFAVLSLCHITYGLMFLWIAISSFASSIICLVMIYFIYNFIFNKEIKFKLAFIIFISSLILLAVSVGLSIMCFMNYDHKEAFDKKDMINKTSYIEIKDNTNIYNYYGNITYKIDNNIENVQLEISYPKELDYEIIHNTDLDYDNYHISLKDESPFKIYKIVKKDLKNNIIRNFNSDDLINIKVTTSQENYDKLKVNIEKDY